MSSKQCEIKAILLGEADVGLVMIDDLAVALIPLSERARRLFYKWGMEKEDDGIVPPIDAMDFVTSVPSHWVMKSMDPEKRMYILREVPLPQPIAVVH